ncbi:MAG: metallophosphoesterase family protein [Lachnospiraceae bacterium]|nr:metallophosphoesterase family protein [Lachnospiraceae bacterium]
MDIAVFSDIHGNHVAFEECMHYVLNRKIDKFIFLGDYLGELPYPQKTMELLYNIKSSHECCFVKGNKEDYWVNHQNRKDELWEDKSSSTGALLYTYTNLMSKDIDFFRDLPTELICNFDVGEPIMVCHGSPNNLFKKMMPNTDNEQLILEQSSFRYNLCGHTHTQRKLMEAEKKLFNPGAIGVPLDSGGKAQFMILHSNGKNDWLEEFVSVEYDRKKIIREIYDSGLYEAAPYWSIITEQLINTGEISHGKVLKRAMKHCIEESGKCDWRKIPERYWKMAVEEMFPNL